MLLMSLGASKRLRGWWLLGSTVITLSSGLPLLAVKGGTGLPEHVQNLNGLLGFVAIVLFLWGMTGYGYWVVAHIIRFFGKHVKDDYRNDKIFER
jgi:Kef-type K+ transport system membrane component KefB